LRQVQLTTEANPAKLFEGQRRERVFLLVLAVLVSFCFFYKLGGAPLFDHDEGAHSEAVREMFERHDFLSTYVNGELFFNKPILTFWLRALSVLLLGFTDAAFRLPSAIAASLWVFGTYFFVRQFIDSETAFVSAFLNATALFVIIIGRAATADALLNLFIALSLFEIYRYLARQRSEVRGQRSEITHQKLFAHRAFLWVGLGFLTKGPIAIFIPFFVSFAFFALQRRWKEWLRLVLNPLGLLIFVVVAFPWYIAQTLKDRGAFLQGFFLRQNIDRYLTILEGHGGTILYYVPVAFIIILPYSFWLFRAFFRVGRAKRDDLELYLWLWFGFVFLFFSFARTKLPHYLLYGATPLFILMARYRSDLRSRFFALLPASLFLALFFALPWVIGASRSYISQPEILATLDEASKYLDTRYQVWLLIALVCIVGLMFVKQWKAWQLLLVSAVVNTAVVVLLLYPTLGSILQEPTREAAAFLRNNNCGEVVMWQLDAPSLSVYRGRATPGRKPRVGETVVTRIDHLHDIARYRVLYQRGAIVVAVVEEIQ
jgi:4-amino-4-deoxy-L-arabinose transferase-like glycosyltransferase